MPMFAPVHARSNAPMLAVVGRPILWFAQSASLRNEVAAMNRSGSSAERQNRPIAIVSGHGFRRGRERRLRGCAGSATVSLTSAALPREDPDLQEPDRQDDQHERHTDRRGIAHVLVRKGLLVNVKLGD